MNASPVIVSSQVETNRVLRNTFMLLGVTMIPTLLGAFAGTQMDWSFMAGSPILSSLLVLAGMLGLMFMVSMTRNSGMGVVFLLGMTGFMGLMTGPLLQTALKMSNGTDLVMLAAGGTALVFFSMATIAMNPKRDFSNLGGILFAGVILLIVAMLANLYFQIPALSLALSAVAVVLFSAFLLYDVNRIVHGGETNYIMATLAIYLDIYNIFVNLLQLLLSFAGED